jgi:transposase-like protein
MRRIAVAHATIQRWVFKFAPLIESKRERTE